MMNRTFLWILLAAGIAGLLLVIYKTQPAMAPLNASGYTYPSTGGA